MQKKYWFPLFSYKALENFSKALYGKTEGINSTHVFRHVMEMTKRNFPKPSCVIAFLDNVANILLLCGLSGC